MTDDGRKISDVAPQELRNLIAGMVENAAFIMGSSEKDADSSIAGWVYYLLSEKYSYMPLHHVKAAFEQGAMGHRGGTSKLCGRTIAIWINEQKAITQEQFARFIKQEDEHKRLDDMNKNKAEGFVATAVRIKVHWLCDGLITSKQYDTFSSKLIYDKLKAGVAERDIHPRDIVPDYQNTINA